MDKPLAQCPVASRVPLKTPGTFQRVPRSSVRDSDTGVMTRNRERRPPCVPHEVYGFPSCWLKPGSARHWGIPKSDSKSIALVRNWTSCESYDSGIHQQSIREEKSSSMNRTGLTMEIQPR